MTVSSILIALVLDFTLGDPPFDWHPVRVLGRQIAFVESYCRALPISERARGGVFAALNMIIFLIPVAAIRIVSSFIGPLGALLNGAVIYFALGGTCLAREVGAVSSALSRGNIGEARGLLRMLVSRDTDGMGETEIASSAIETLAENFSDSAAATLLYAALGGPVLAWIHRVANTMDAMVGYKTEAYAEFGYVSAKLDDALNFIPARASAAIIALAAKSAGDPGEAARVAIRDGGALDSPNSGYPIAAFAGALGVKLCGPVSYFGKLKDKPFIGDGPRPGADDLSRALSLYWPSYLLASALAVLLALICQ